MEDTSKKLEARFFLLFLTIVLFGNLLAFNSAFAAKTETQNKHLVSEHLSNGTINQVEGGD